MASDEPSGPTGPTDVTQASGPTESSGPTGPTVNYPFLTFEQIIESPPVVITLDELIQSHGAVLAKEVLDKSTVSVLLNENGDTLRTSLFQWAALGFPTAHIIKTFTLDPPNVCSDGISRSISEYFMYCLGTDMVTLLEKLKSVTQGMNFSYSFLENTLRIHVSRV
jgi:hypothetical protein